MAIIYRSNVQHKIEQLDAFYLQLTEVLAGQPVDGKEASLYVGQPERAEALVNINLDRLRDAVGHFKVSVESLKSLKAEKPNKIPYYGCGNFPYDE